VRGILLRFAFCYWCLFCIPVITTQVSPLAWMGRLISPALRVMVVWVGAHVLAIPYEIHTGVGGSGDKTADWVFLFCSACLSLIATAVWSLLDRRRAGDARLRELLRVVIRYTLAFVILGYGVSKVFFGQFSPPSAARLTQTYGESSPMGLLWTFMGASPAYVFFSGAAETLGGLLLLFRRTTTLGALVLTTVLTNVVMMNLCYDVPVKILSSHYLAMSIFLLLPELRRLANVLVLHRPTQPALRPLVLPRRWMRIARRVLKYGVIAYILFLDVKPGVERVTRGPAPWYDGAWDVTAFNRDGNDLPATAANATRWKRISFLTSARKNYIRWRNMDASYSDLYALAIDAKAQTMTFAPDPDIDATKPGRLTGPAVVTYTRIDADHLTMTGKVGAVTLTMQLQRVSAQDMLLVSRGFHWISEEPFSR
jgi:uncharacterized membrane protein YphA (DoxX/SURF4 family)